MALDPLRISGFGGIDIEQLVEAMMLQAEYRVQQLQEERAAVAAQKSLWSDIDSKVDALDDLLASLARGDTLGAKAVSSSDADRLAATASVKAQIGSYAIVIHQRAAAQMIHGERQETDSALNLSGSPELNGKVVTITAGMTLGGIRDAINAADAGVTAQIIDGYLFLTGETGAANAITLQDDGGVLTALGLLDAGGNIRHEQQAAADARLTVNGLEIARSTNQISDVIPGVTLDLLKADPETTVTLTVDQDVAADQKTVHRIVDQINAIIDFTRAQTAENGKLRGESSTLRVLEDRIKRALLSEIPAGNGTIRHGFALGLSWGRDGRVAVDAAKLTEALQKDPEGVQAFFQAEGGAIARLREVAEQYASLDGVFVRRQESVDRVVDRLDRQIEQAQYVNARREDLIRAQFIRMQRVMVQMNAWQSGFGTTDDQKS